MSDDHLPYEGAIEETAKAAGKAVDLVREGFRAVGQPIADIYGRLIGDKMSASRLRNLDALARETNEILNKRDTKTRRAAPEQIAIPLLEAAQGETRDELRTRWARLLANSMDPERAENVRPEYIHVLSKLEPIDALILEYLVAHPASGSERVQKHTMGELIGRRQSAATLSIDHLDELGCIRYYGGGANFLTLTELGTELMIAAQE
jgi:hypothetical protein